MYLKAACKEANLSEHCLMHNIFTEIGPCRLLETETNTQETRRRPILFAKTTIITHYKSQSLTVIDHVASPRIMAQFGSEFVIFGSEFVSTHEMLSKSRRCALNGALDVKLHHVSLNSVPSGTRGLHHIVPVRVFSEFRRFQVQVKGQIARHNARTRCARRQLRVQMCPRAVMKRATRTPHAMSCTYLLMIWKHTSLSVYDVGVQKGNFEMTARNERALFHLTEPHPGTKWVTNCRLTICVWEKCEFCGVFASTLRRSNLSRNYHYLK